MRASRHNNDVGIISSGGTRDSDAAPLFHGGGEVTPHNGGGLTTPRRIVKSLRQPPTCVTQLVQLDGNSPAGGLGVHNANANANANANGNGNGNSNANNFPHRQQHHHNHHHNHHHHAPRLYSSGALSAVPSECSVSEVRSELCSVAMDDHGEVSISSFFNPNRARQQLQIQQAHTQQQRRASFGRADVARSSSSSTSKPRNKAQAGAAAGGGDGGGSRRRLLGDGGGGGGKATAAGGRLPRASSRDIEGSALLSYSDSGSFYSGVSMDNSSRSASFYSSRSCSSSYRSISYTAISESVPSCSLTVMGDQLTRVPAAGAGVGGSGGWAGRGRRNPAIPRQSGSFGSIFGGGGIDPYDGTSLANSQPSGGKAGSTISHPLHPHHANRKLKRSPEAAVDLGINSSGGDRAGILRGAHKARTPPPAMDLHPVPSPPAHSPAVTPGKGDGASGVSPRAAEEGGGGKRKTVTIAAKSPRKEHRSSLFDADAPTAAAAAAVAAASSVVSTVGGSGSATLDCSGFPDAAAGASSSANGGEESPVWRVQSVRREERVGRGSYGDVYRGIDLDTGRVIAIKEILVPKDFTKDLEKQLMTLEREIRVMRKLNHPNTINYLGATRDDNSLNIYMEYVAGGTVGELLRDGGPLSEARTRAYTAQLLCGLEYLHQRQIVHRDLKGDNLFLSDGDVVKLGDFGTSKELVTTLVTDSVAGTPNFMAPEVIACSGHSYAADIWSVGCCVLEMLTGAPPFARLDNHMAVMFAVMKGRLEEQVPEHISGGAKDFIRVCTCNDPKDRWDASQLRQHRWLLEGSSSSNGGGGGAVAATTAAAASPPTSAMPSPGPASPFKLPVAHNRSAAALSNNNAIASTCTSGGGGGGGGHSHHGTAEEVLPRESRRPLGDPSLRSPSKKTAAARTGQAGKGPAPTAAPATGSSSGSNGASDALPVSPSLSPPSSRRRASGDLMPPIATPTAAARKKKSAVPLEPAALARSGGGGGGRTTSLPMAGKSPAGALDDSVADGGGGVSSSNPSNVNTPGSGVRSSGGDGGGNGSGGRAKRGGANAGGTEGSGGASSRTGSSGRRTAAHPTANGGKLGSAQRGGAPSRTGSSAGALGNSVNTSGSSHVSPSRFRSGSFDDDLSGGGGGGRSRNTTTTIADLNLSSSYGGGSGPSQVVATPPACTPTNNPRRPGLVGSASSMASSPIASKAKRNAKKKSTAALPGQGLALHR